MSLFWLIIIVLLVLWAAGYWGVGYSRYQGNNTLHVLLVVAVILILLNVTGVMHTGLRLR